MSIKQLFALGLLSLCSMGAGFAQGTSAERTQVTQLAKEPGQIDQFGLLAGRCLDKFNGQLLYVYIDAGYDPEIVRQTFIVRDGSSSARPDVASFFFPLNRGHFANAVCGRSRRAVENGDRAE